MVKKNESPVGNDTSGGCHIYHSITRKNEETSSYVLTGNY
jgi:hypothetical protein